MRKAGLIGAFGSVLLGLLKVKEMQICGSFFNSHELKGTWNILYKITETTFAKRPEFLNSLNTSLIGTINNKLVYVGEFTSRRRRVGVGEFARSCELTGYPGKP